MLKLWNINVASVSVDVRKKMLKLLCILTLLKGHASFIDEIFTIYRPEKVRNDANSINRTFHK